MHLEPELGHRPDRVMGLHLGHRDPRGGALGRVVQHGAVRARRAGGGERARPARAPPTAPAARGARSGLPRRRAAAPRSARSRRSARRWCGGPGLLVRRVFCPACWCSSHSVRRDGGLPCTASYSLGQPVQLAGDGDGAGAEQVLHVLADAADLGAVAVRPGHHHVAERGQLGLQDPVGDRGDAEPLVVQASGSPASATCRRRRRRAGPGSRSPRARGAAGRRRGTGDAGTSWRSGRRRRATPPCGPNGGRCACRSACRSSQATASRAESISAASSSSARASSAAAWSWSPRWRAWRAATR